MRTRLAAPAGLLTLLVMAAGCGDDGAGDLTIGDDAEITYHFGDSSVPPEHHRSYTLTIDASSVHAVVDSYGDVLEDVTADLPPEVWDRLVADAGTVAGLDPSGGDDDGGCAGGTSRSITVSEGGETMFERELSVCGGAGEEAAEVLDGYIRPVLDAIPNWNEIVAT